MGNLFSDLPAELPQELLETLAEGRSTTIERIVSRGHVSPDGFWYDQPRSEWVLVLRGQARVRLENSDEDIELSPGDWLDIPARCRHRVEWTSPDEETIWLAVHYGD